MLDSPRRPSSTIRIFSSAEYRRRVARRMSRIALSALSFFFVIIVPLQGNDESNVSLIQIAYLVRLLLTEHNVGSDTATLSGELLDGSPFEGSDSICVVP
jgi:hypothetical protein